MLCVPSFPPVLSVALTCGPLICIAISMSVCKEKKPFLQPWADDENSAEGINKNERQMTSIRSNPYTVCPSIHGWMIDEIENGKTIERPSQQSKRLLVFSPDPFDTRSFWGGF